MKKFLVIYHVPSEAMARMAEVPAEQQAEGMKAWMDWAGRCGSHLVDMGAPLFNGQSIGSDGSHSTSDKQVSGYSVLEAEDMDEAKSLLTGHPHISGWHPEATIEIHETMQLPGM